MWGDSLPQPGAPLRFQHPLSVCLSLRFTRPLFTRERLNYAREFKSGISSVGYFFARNLRSRALRERVVDARRTAVFLSVELCSHENGRPFRDGAGAS